MKTYAELNDGSFIVVLPDSEARALVGILNIHESIREHVSDEAEEPGEERDSRLDLLNFPWRSRMRFELLDAVIDGNENVKEIIS